MPIFGNKNGTKYSTASGLDLRAFERSPRWPSPAASWLTPAGRLKGHRWTAGDPQATFAFLQSGRSCKLFDDLGRLQQKRVWNLQAQRFGGLAVDDQFIFRGLLDRYVAGFRTFENLVDIKG